VVGNLGANLVELFRRRLALFRRAAAGGGRNAAQLAGQILDRMQTDRRGSADDRA